MLWIFANSTNTHRHSVIRLNQIKRAVDLSVKDIKEHYEKVNKNYMEMISLLHELEKEAETSIVSPERVEQFEQSIQPVKDQFETWSWIMYLLNLPNKKEKKKRYVQLNEKEMNKIGKKNHYDTKLNESKEIVENLKS